MRVKRSSCFKDRTGEKHITNEGYEVEIIEYRNNRECYVKFITGNVQKVEYGVLLKGKLKNKLHPSVYGVGYFGIGKYKRKDKSYNKWFSLMGRSYCKDIHSRQLSYEKCTVNERWYNFQVFGEWFEKNYNPETMQDWQLDKDILVKGNKHYSPETCCFVPHEINSLFTNRERDRGALPLGVTKYCKSHKYIARVYKNGKNSELGSFDTPEEAFQAYKVAKEKHIKEVADKWKNLITPRVYQAMYEYQVEITD